MPSNVSNKVCKYSVSEASSFQTMIRIWDTFLYEGSKVLFRYAVAIFLYNQGDLLAEKNSIDIFNRLRSMCKEATDVKRLTEVNE